MLKELLSKQKDYIDHFFEFLDIEKAEKILQTILRCEGSLVFSGVGKSGIIAEKLAMTMVSIGTRAFYLPAMNALHGDLGALSDQDLFICISKSGESEELIQLLPFVKARGVKTMGWLCSENNRLSDACDDVILLPLKRELCPFDLAPTTSTALQLIFGDVIAVGLMQAKRVGLDELAKNHPGGLIGKKLILKIEDIMLKGEDLPLCRAEDTLGEILIELTKKRCGCVLIVDEALTLKGIFTDGDLRRVLQKNSAFPMEEKMRSVMTESCEAIEKGQLLLEALRLMQKKPDKWIKELPVLESGKVVGLIRMHDIVQQGIRFE